MISTPITPTPSSVTTESIRTLHLWAFMRMADGCTRAGKTAQLAYGTSGVECWAGEEAAWGEGSQGNVCVGGGLSGYLEEGGKQQDLHQSHPALRPGARLSFPFNDLTLPPVGKSQPLQAPKVEATLISREWELFVGYQ